MAVTSVVLTDAELIASTIRHPRIWPSVSDDGSPLPEDFMPIMSDSVIYLGMFESGAFHGLFMLHQHNAICWEVHTCLLPTARGNAHCFAEKCVEWVFSETACRRLITNVPAGNALAIRLASSVGMIQFGINHASFLKNGAVLDQIMLGISKE